MIGIAHAMGPTGGGAQGGGSQYMGIVMLVAMVAIFYFLLIRPQKKKQQQHKNFLESLKKGDEVVTAGGLCGRITGLTDNYVTIEIAEKVRVKVLRNTVVDTVKGE